VTVRPSPLVTHSPNKPFPLIETIGGRALSRPLTLPPDVETAPVEPTEAERAPQKPRVPHILFAGLLAGGLLLRVVTQLGFRPAFWFNDSFEYLGIALRWDAYLIRPNGYSAYLWLLRPSHSIAAVTVSQHLMGLGIAVAGYVLLLRHGVRRWLAALAAVPVLFNPYQIQLEHLVMSDTLFLGLVVAALVVLLWHRKPGPRTVAVVGLLIAAASLTRSLGPALVGLVGIYLLARRTGWRGLVALAVAAVVPLAGYAAWFKSEHGSFAMSSSEGIYLYSRVIPFADCAKIEPPQRLRPLCESRPVGKRWEVGSGYIWWDGPLDRIPLSRKASVEVPEDRFDPARNEAAREFAMLALRAQPGDYLRVVAKDVARGFAWERDVYPSPYVYNMYEFSERPHNPPAGRVFVSGATWEQDMRAYAHGDARTQVVRPAAGWMMWYQKHATFPGPVLAVLFVVALAGIAVRRARDDRRLTAGLLVAVGAALLVLPSLTAQFDHRYVLVAIPFAAWSAALGLSMLAGRASPPRS